MKGGPRVGLGYSDCTALDVHQHHRTVVPVLQYMRYNVQYILDLMHSTALLHNRYTTYTS